MDLLGRKRTGELYLYPGTGTGKATSRAGSSAGVGRSSTRCSPPATLTGDQRADLIARTPGGLNYVYAGNGSGGFATGARTLTVTWGATTRIFGVR